MTKDSFIRGILFFDKKNFVSPHLQFFFEKCKDIFFCLLAKILIPKYLELKKSNKEDELSLRENKIKGGSKESEEKEFTVFPINLFFELMLITVTPVTNEPSAFLKFFLLIFLIYFFLHYYNV